MYCRTQGTEVHLVYGDGADIAYTLRDGTGADVDWPLLPSLSFAGSADRDAEVVLTVEASSVEGAVAHWTLTAAQVDAIAAATDQGRGARTWFSVTRPDPGDPSGRSLVGGQVSWSTRWVMTDRRQSLVLTVPGPPGRGVVSITDPDATGTATITYTDGTTALLPLPGGGGGGSDEALRSELRAATTGTLSILGNEGLVSALPDAEAGEFPLSALYDFIGSAYGAALPLTGGVEGQILTRRNDAPYAPGAPYQWDDPPVALPAGGTTGQLLAKASDDDGDAAWTTVPAGQDGADGRGIESITDHGDGTATITYTDQTTTTLSLPHNGPPNVLSIGTVTQGPAAATITGTAPAQTLNLTLPPGPAGPAGVSSIAPGEYELRGTGMPEGVVTAPVGTYYTDAAVTNGAWRWFKKSGTGSTGWIVDRGDTGWRDVSSWLDPAVWGTIIAIYPAMLMWRMTERGIETVLNAKNISGANTTAVIPALDGFHPGGPNQAVANQHGFGFITPNTVLFEWNYYLQHLGRRCWAATSVITNNSAKGRIIYTPRSTSAPWVATLPGTALPG